MYSIAEKYKNDDGETIVKIDLESSTIPYVTVDTYQTFNGDSWAESEYDWLQQEQGIEDAWRYVDTDYNTGKILEELSEASISGIVDQLYDSPIEGIEYVSHWSPAYYNFQTDTYTATYTVNWTQLKRWIKEEGHDLEAWVQEHWSSYDGFHSHIYPGYWNDPEHAKAMRVWAAVAIWVEHNIDRDALFMHVAEQEWEIYSNNTTLSIKEDDYATLLAKFLGEDAPAEVQEQMGYDTDWLDNLMEYRGTTLEALMAEHPLDPREAAETLAQRPDTEAINGQLAAL